jgi:hypothetical protein
MEIAENEMRSDKRNVSSTQKACSKYRKIHSLLDLEMIVE